jgi:hemolysin-activating ACP:hemolysin acyltransferase
LQTSFPKDWFNLPRETLADMGAIFFLAALSPEHRKHTLAQVFYGFETPIRLKQYHIFRDKAGYPRGFTTFAGLSPDVERAYAIDRTPLRPEDWTSGPSFWLIDFVMPFGQTAAVVEKLKSDLPYDRVRTNRIVGDMKTHRIVEWFRREDRSVGVKLYRPAEFGAQIDGG